MSMRPKNIILKSLATIIICLPFSLCCAQDYHQLGKDFLLAKSKTQLQLSDSFKFMKEIREKNLIILESSNPDCFVIILKSSKNPKVIAYSTQNEYSGKMKEDELAEQTDFTRELSRIPVRYFSRKSGNNSKRIPVGPLLKTKWNQNRWYNIYCPYDIRSNAGEHDLTGCVATAMGQIIRYYGKWNDFIIDKEYTLRDKVIRSSADNYEWSQMSNEPQNYDLEVSKLLADLGVLVEMCYGPEFSSKGFGYARKKGFSNIEYDSAKPGWRRQDENWLDKIYADLEKYHPVMIGGGNHAYVCDGYDEEGRLHFNMGWGGMQDGYYDPSCVASLKYYSEEAVFGAYPAGYEQFLSPESIRIEDIDGKSSIVWSSPDYSGNITSYNVYYTDNEWFSIGDTIICIDDLKPGEHDIMVSAVYPEGESIWIGPVKVLSEGQQVTGLDDAMIRAIESSLSKLNVTGHYDQFFQGHLEMIQELNVSESCLNINILKEMPNIQELSLDATGLTSIDLQNIYCLPNLQNLKLSFYSGQMPDLSQLHKLVQLELSSCAFEDLSFVKEIDNLMILELENCNISDSQIPENLKMLVDLSLIGTRLSETFNINHFKELRILKLQDCGLTSFDIYSPLNKLICLDVSKNQLVSTDFLQYFPLLKMVCASHNNFEEITLSNKYPYLYNVDFSHNNIDTIHMEFKLKSLGVIDLSFNEFMSLPDLKKLPVIHTMNLSDNHIRGFNEFASPTLKSLNISNNSLIHLDGVEKLEAIHTLDIRGNMISDISPLVENNLIAKLKYLNLDVNPLSDECFKEYLPYLRKTPKEFHLPDEYEPGSPCYPEVYYNEIQDVVIMNLSWYCESESYERNFDVFLNEGDGFLKIERGLSNSFAELEIDQNKSYQWFVRANFKDTCFYSGLYSTDEYDEGTGSYVESENIETISISVYPNPASQYIKIKGLPLNSGLAKIRIINAAGQVVKQEILDPQKGQYQLAVDRFAKGLYFYQVSAQKKTIGSGNILIAN